MGWGRMGWDGMGWDGMGWGWVADVMAMLVAAGCTRLAGLDEPGGREVYAGQPAGSGRRHLTRSTI